MFFHLQQYRYFLCGFEILFDWIVNRHSGEQRRHCGRLHSNVNSAAEYLVEEEVWFIYQRGPAVHDLSSKRVVCCCIHHFLSSYLVSSLYLKGAALIKLMKCIRRHIRISLSQLDAFVILALCCYANTCLPHLKQSNLFMFGVQLPELACTRTWLFIFTIYCTTVQMPTFSSTFISQVRCYILLWQSAVLHTLHLCAS